MNIHRRENQKTYTRSTELIKKKTLSLGLQFVDDISGQTTGSIFKGQTEFLFDCMTLEDGIDKFSRNVGNQQPTHAAVTCLKSEYLSYATGEA
jgi:hypothetical protein